MLEHFFHAALTPEHGGEETAHHEEQRHAKAVYGLHEDKFVWTKFFWQFHADYVSGLMDFGRHLPVRRLGVLNRPVFFAHKRNHAVQQNAQQHRRRAQGVEVMIPFLIQNGR